MSSSNHKSRPIQKLADLVIDQIAAGEVVERPSHLVKELIENALDAKAQEIQVEFDMTKRWLRVVDNGMGIPDSELSLSIQRHTTSKIVSQEDLYDLNSFGFRGEALSSAAAVSDLSLVSRQADAAVGAELRVEFGQIKSVEPRACEPGTQVTVNDLFGNVPARLKFMKAPTAEASAIKSTVKALALVHPEVEWRVLEKSELIYFWKRGSWEKRVREIISGVELNFHQITSGDYELRLAFSSPHVVARQNRYIWFFVQGRWIQDRMLHAAVMEAYRTQLMNNEYPYVVVDLRCPPSDVDINVHPNKSQIKFRDGKLVFRMITQSLGEALARGAGSSSGLIRSHQQSRSTDALDHENLVLRDRAFDRVQMQTLSPWENRTEPITPELSRVSERVECIEHDEREDVLPPQREKLFGQMQVLGQVQHMYILAQDIEHLYVFDQHAVHERIIFERLKAAFVEGSCSSQLYLIPLRVTLPEDQVEGLMKAEGVLKQMGIEVDRIMPDTLAVRAKPDFLSDAAMKKGLELAGERWGETQDERTVQHLADDLLATMACHSVIRSGDVLSHAQMKTLLEQMDESPRSQFCPHGRPVFIKIPFQHLERSFGRQGSRLSDLEV